MSYRVGGWLPSKYFGWRQPVHQSTIYQGQGYDSTNLRVSLAFSIAFVQWSECPMIFVGIDVASTKHDCAVLDSTGKVLCEFVIANDIVGFETLISRLQAVCNESQHKLSDIQIGLESTGHYNINIVKYLHEKRLSVKVFNPLSVARLKKASTLRRTKTDKTDARFLAVMLFNNDSKPYEQSVAQMDELKTLTRHRGRLVKESSEHKLHISRLITIVFPEFASVFSSTSGATARAILLEFPSAHDIAKADIRRLTGVVSKASKNRFGRDKADEIRTLAKKSIGTSDRALCFELKQHLAAIAFIKEQISKLEAFIKEIMIELNNPITTIPGIGYTLGAIIISEIGSIENFATPAKLLAYAGLDPSTYQSGKFTATLTPMVKHGSTYLRYALMTAATTVKRNEPTFEAYFNKKQAEGKHYFVAASHTAKKLVRVIFHLLKYNETYAPQAVAV